jgi:hypothetical protein
MKKTLWRYLMNFRPAERFNTQIDAKPLALPIGKLTNYGIEQLCNCLREESGLQFEPFSTRGNGLIDAIVSKEPIKSTSAAYIAFSKKVEAGVLFARQVGQCHESQITGNLHRERLIIHAVSGRMMGLPNLDPPAPDLVRDQALARRRREQRPR